MKGVPKIGETGVQEFVVNEQHLIDFANDGTPGILCTPWLVWFLEHAAINTLSPLLETGEATVGVTVNVEHIAATPCGTSVLCRARVIYVDGPEVTFQIEAHDEYEMIARGTHKRRVITAARLAKRVAGKTRGNSAPASCVEPT